MAPRRATTRLSWWSAWSSRPGRACWTRTRSWSKRRARESESGALTAGAGGERDEAVDVAVVRAEVELARAVHSEREHGSDARQSPLPPLDGVAVHEAAGSKPGLAIVRIDVAAGPARQRAPAIDEAPDHRAALPVVVLDRRRRHPRRIARWMVAVGAFESVPAVVETGAPRVRDVDLFPMILADVGDDQAMLQRIEAEAPWIAQSNGPDLRARASAPHIGIVARDRVRIAGVHVQSQELAEQGAGILAVAVWIALRAAVPHADIELAVLAEAEAAAVVVRVGLVHREHELARSRIGGVRIAAHPVALDARVPRSIRVVHEEEAVAGV